MGQMSHGIMEESFSWLDAKMLLCLLGRMSFFQGDT